MKTAKDITWVFMLALLASILILFIGDALDAQTGVHFQSGIVRLDRIGNPPTNVFLVSTPHIADLGWPICIDHITATATLFSGDRNDEGDDRSRPRVYTLELDEQHNGITRPRTLNFGSGHLRSIKIEV